MSDRSIEQHELLTVDEAAALIRHRALPLSGTGFYARNFLTLNAFADSVCSFRRSEDISGTDFAAKSCPRWLPN